MNVTVAVVVPVAVATPAVGALGASLPHTLTMPERPASERTDCVKLVPQYIKLRSALLPRKAPAESEVRVFGSTNRFNEAIWEKTKLSISVTPFGITTLSN